MLALFLAVPALPGPVAEAAGMRPEKENGARQPERRESLLETEPGKRSSPAGKLSPNPPEGEQEARDLQDVIDRLRLEFLSLPKERREALIAAQQTGLVHSETALTLARERSAAEQQKDEAIRSLEIAEEQRSVGKGGGGSVGRSTRPRYRTAGWRKNPSWIGQGNKKLPIGYPFPFEGDEHPWAKQSGSRSP